MEPFLQSEPIRVSAWEPEQPNGEWSLLPLPLRVDTFNIDQVKGRMQSARSHASRVALDLTTTQFLSIPFIQWLYKEAQALRLMGGDLVLIGPGEKLKKQVHIYASLEPMKIFRSIQDWKNQAEISELNESSIF